MFFWNVKLVGLLLIFSYFLVCAQLQRIDEAEVIGSREPIQGVAGEDVLLPCHLEPPFDVTSLTVEWRHNENNIVHVYRSTKDDFSSQHQQFKDRTSLFREEMKHGNISLKLTNVTTNDTGDYTCYVPRLKSQVKKGNLTLTVYQTSRGEEVHDNGDTAKIIGGGVGGGAVVLLVIIAIVAILIWKRNEGQQPQHNAQQPNDGAELQPLEPVNQP